MGGDKEAQIESDFLTAGSERQDPTHLKPPRRLRLYLFTWITHSIIHPSNFLQFLTQKLLVEAVLYVQDKRQVIKCVL